jgi:diguanylate cyclase (GGDEF)-like protein
MSDTTTSPRPPSVLIVNSHEWLARSFGSLLTPQGYRVEFAYLASQAHGKIQSSPPDVILVADRLEDADGVEFCRGLRTDPAVGPVTPILLTSPTPLRRSRRLEALRAGVWECLAGPFDAQELLHRLHVYAAAKLETERIRQASLVDGATGLYNARGLLQQARALVGFAFRYRRPLGCVAFGPARNSHDLASEGSPEALRHVASVLKVRLRQADVAGRCGVADFLVLAPEAEPEGAAHLARRILQELEAALRQLPTQTRIGYSAGYYGTSHFRAEDLSLEATRILGRALVALRRVQAEGSPGRVASYI